VKQVQQRTEPVGVINRPETWYPVVTEKERKVPLQKVLKNPEDNALSLSEFESENLGRNRAEYARDIPATKELARQCGVHVRTAAFGGNIFSKLPHDVPGISTPFFYLGNRGSVFSTHIEDEDTFSINLLHRGEKIWVILPPNQKIHLENYFEWVYRVQNRESPQCDQVSCTQHRITRADRFQFIRHLNVYIPTAMLDILHIRYRIIHQRPGQAVITFPQAYHQGLNATANVAEAMNFATEDWIPKSYAYCSPNCARFYPQDWQPMNLAVESQHLTQLEFQINPLESVTWSHYFEVKKQLGRDVPSNYAKRRTLGRKVSTGPKSTAALGGRFADDYMRLMIRLADHNTLRHLNLALDISDSHEYPASTLLNLSILEKETDSDCYMRYRLSRAQSVQADVHERFAALYLSRAIKTCHDAVVKTRSHKAGNHTTSEAEIVHETAKNITAGLSDKQKDFVGSLCDPKETILMFIAKDLLQLHTVGTWFLDFAAEFGDEVVMVFPKDDIPKYVFLQFVTSGLHSE
jgi:hypothetical protein